MPIKIMEVEEFEYVMNGEGKTDTKYFMIGLLVMDIEKDCR